MSDPPTTAEQPPEALAFQVSADEEGLRLDAYLAARVAGLSRARVKRLIEDGDVLIGGRVAKPSHKVRAGEEIEVELTEPPPLDLVAEDIPLDVTYEDEDIIVINKPAGLVVHPGAGAPRGTLANALAHHFRQLPDRPGALRPGVVHRLDKETSGLIVVAKNEAAHESLSEQFRARTVHKSYAALVHGRVRGESGRVEEPLGRDPRQRTRMAVVRGGRPALTIYRVRRRYERFTLLDVEIKTGRTHQIRVHLASAGHPVVGDEVYGMGRDRNVAEARLRRLIAALGRHFLHARSLAFRHPRTSAELRFEAPLPAALASFLAALDEGAADAPAAPPGEAL